MCQCKMVKSQRNDTPSTPTMVCCKAVCKPSSVPNKPSVYTSKYRGFIPMAYKAAIIYLAQMLPSGSSGQPKGSPPTASSRRGSNLRRTGHYCPLLGLAPDGVCLASNVTTGAVSSYLTISPLSRPIQDGMFLWHFPSGRPAPPLAGILPGGARTFLSLNQVEAAIAQPPCTCRLYFEWDHSSLQHTSPMCLLKSKYPMQPPVHDRLRHLS